MHQPALVDRAERLGHLLADPHDPLDVEPADAVDHLSQRRTREVLPSSVELPVVSPKS